MTSVVASEAISAVLTSSPSPSVNTTKNSSSHFTSIDIIEVVVGSVAFCLILGLILFYVLVLHRSRQKYLHPEDKSKFVDTIESAPEVFGSKSSQDDWRSIPQRERNVSLFTNQTQQSLSRSLVTSESQLLKDAYAVPSSFIDIGLVTPKTHSTTSNIVQSPTDTVVSKTATLRPILAPLSIPQTPLNHSNGKRSIKRKGTRQSSQTTDLGWETDDSASLYSEASGSFPYHSTSYLGTTLPPPMPIPLRSTALTQSTLPESITFISARRREEETIIKNPLVSEPLPALRFSRDSAEEDKTEIYNVAKLLHSRQLKAPNRFSRNSSVVSHIERSGSIRPVIAPSGEEGSESYRPRYYRSKQKRNSYTSNGPSIERGDSFLIMPSLSLGQLRNSQVVGS